MKCTGERVVGFLVCLQIVRPFPVISTVTLRETMNGETDGYRTIEIATLSELDHAIDILVHDIKTRVQPLQNSAGKPCDEIRLELWIDSGRIICFPANSPIVERIDAGGCQILCKELADSVAALDESDCDDAEYAARFEALEARVADSARNMVTGQFPRFSIRNPDGRSI
jgi:hypothetical protein